jgi:hypothetical protein
MQVPNSKAKLFKEIELGTQVSHLIWPGKYDARKRDTVSFFCQRVSTFWREAVPLMNGSKYGTVSV